MLPGTFQQPPQGSDFPAGQVSAPVGRAIDWIESAGSNLTVLVVDDQASIRAVTTAMLRSHGYSVIEAGSAEAALEQFLKVRPHIVLLDVEMPGHDGYWVAARMRELEPDGWTPIIYLSGRTQELNYWQGVEAGGDDYLVKPASVVVLISKLRAMLRLADMRQRLVEVSAELRIANERLKDLAVSDALTGLTNRRGLDQRLQQEIATALREQAPLSIFLCDVDHFKLYNDTLGHAQGDECLQQVAQVLKEVCKRPRDLAARYGGEEFVLVMPHTPRSGALTMGRTLLNMLRLRALPHPNSSTGPYVSLSGGITTLMPGESRSAEDMLLRADEALYTAKGMGRNRFFSYELRQDTTI